MRKERRKKATLRRMKMVCYRYLWVPSREYYLGKVTDVFCYHFFIYTFKETACPRIFSDKTHAHMYIHTGIYCITLAFFIASSMTPSSSDGSGISKRLISLPQPHVD